MTDAPTSHAAAVPGGRAQDERYHATVGAARLTALLTAYDEPRGAVLPLALMLRDAGVDLDVDALDWVARVCGTSIPVVRGAITAFPELDGRGDRILVCDGPSCRLMGAAAVYRQLRDRLGETRVQRSPCHNACSCAPAFSVRGVQYGALSADALDALVQRLAMVDPASSEGEG